MFGKQADLSYLRVMGTRAFAHVEGFTKKLQARAWEGVLIGYDNDKPAFRVYDRHIGQVSSYRNVSFIEETPAVVPTTRASWGIETEGTEVSNLDSDDTIDNATTSLENDFSNSTNDKIDDTSRDDASRNDTSRVKPFSMRLRSSASADNGEQAMAHHQLALLCQQASSHQFENITQYVGAVRIRDVLPPAFTPVPNTFAQVTASPQAKEWQEAMRKELQSLEEQEVADLIASTSVPPGCSIIGTRGVFGVKTDGRFKARLVVQGWAQQHGLDCFTTFAPVCRTESQRILLANAASRDWPVLALDAQIAFLDGQLQENVYTKQAPCSRR